MLLMRTLALLAGLLLLAACGRGEGKPAPAASAGPKAARADASPGANPGPPRFGGRLVEATIGEPSNLIPPLASDSASHEVADLIYVGLLKYDKNINLVPQAAETGKKGAIENTIRETNASFGATLAKAVMDVNALQTQAGNAVQSMVRGDAVDLHEVMVAVEKAKTSFELLMEIRNKTISAYQELMRLQV